MLPEMSIFEIDLRVQSFSLLKADLHQEITQNLGLCNNVVMEIFLQEHIPLWNEDLFLVSTTTISSSYTYVHDMILLWPRVDLQF